MQPHQSLLFDYQLTLLKRGQAKNRCRRQLPAPCLQGLQDTNVKTVGIAQCEREFYFISVSTLTVIGRNLPNERQARTKSHGGALRYVRGSAFNLRDLQKRYTPSPAHNSILISLECRRIATPARRLSTSHS
jgi:hypothetical protein